MAKEQSKTKSSIQKNNKKTDKNLTNQGEDFIDKVVWIFKSWRGIWDAFTKNIVTLLIIWLVPTLLFTSAFIALIAGFISAFGISSSINGTVEVSSFSSVGSATIILSLILFVVAVIVSIILSPAHYVVQLKSVSNKKISFKEAWNESLHYILRIILLTILVGLLTAIPVILSILLIPLVIGIFLLIPAFILSILVFFFTILSPYILIDKDIKVIPAIKESYYLSKNQWQWVLSVIIVFLTIQAVLLLLSNIIPVLGSLVATIIGIISTFIVAFVYRKKIS